MSSWKAINGLGAGEIRDWRGIPGHGVQGVVARGQEKAARKNRSQAKARSYRGQARWAAAMVVGGRSGGGRGLILHRAFFEFALESAAMHAQGARGGGNIAPMFDENLL